LYLFEIKAEGGRMTCQQQCWHDLWRGQVAVIRSIEQAFAIMGVVADAS
jgi:hypothetical protein